MKNRHWKTIIERYCEPSRFKTKNELISYTIEFNRQLHLYQNSINKTESKFNFNDAMNFCNVKTKGVFYLNERSTYRVQYDDIPSFLVDLDGSDDRYTKFYVVESSDDGWVLVLYFNIHNTMDYEFINNNKILLEGNVGTLI